MFKCSTCDVCNVTYDSNNSLYLFSNILICKNCYTTNEELKNIIIDFVSVEEMEVE